MAKQYLGDSVYADFDGYYVVLTTEDGIKTTNTIYLEPTVTAALEAYLKTPESAPEVLLPFKVIQR
jgi:hypothetical protein